MPHGQITSATCPYSCKTQGIDKRNCRDWRNGNLCYVEDLTRPANPTPISPPQIPTTRPPSSPIRPFPTPLYPPARPPIRPDNPVNPLNSNCDTIDRSAIAQPSIYISDVKSSGNFFGSKIKVQGYVEGICLVEAGGYENGRRVASIPVTKSSNFKRFEFKITLDGSNNAEVRVYNINGERDIYSVGGESSYDNPNGGSNWSW